MTTLNPPPANRSLARRRIAAPSPFVMAVHQSHRPLPSSSLRVPVTPANRSFLRELRAAEMRAWHNPSVGGTHAAAAAGPCDSRRERKERFSFAMIVALTLTLAGVVLAQSTSVTQQYAHLVSLVRHFLG